MKVKFKYHNPDNPNEVVPGRSSIFDMSYGVYKDSEGLLWFHIKGDSYDVVDDIFEKLEKILNSENLAQHHVA